MTSRHPIRFGLQTAPEGAEWLELVKVWKFAEDLGYDTIWTSDHFVTSLFQDEPETTVLDGWTALAGLAVLTSRVRLGVMITGNMYRHPPQLARIAATIDRMTNGRLIMGIGAGWHELEHGMYGVPFPSPAERAHRMAETVQIFKLLWTEPRATFKGDYYELRDAIAEPKPVQKPHIPIWIGGWGEKIMLKYVAMYGDGWNLTGSPISLPPKLEALERHCESVGRDIDEIEKSVMHMGLYMTEDQEWVRRYIEGRSYKRAQGFENMKGHFMIGTTEEMRETIGKLIDLGFTHFVAQIVQPYDYDAIERWYREVALSFKAA